MVTPKRKLEPFKRASLPAPVLRCRRKFLRFFPKGFYDETYIDWERNYKWEAHQSWNRTLDRKAHESLLQKRDFTEVASRAIRIESRTNLLFSFEKMALRDAVKSNAGARLFSKGLYDFLYESEGLDERFDRWCEVVASLPRKQTRVLTWPVVTVFGFIAQPQKQYAMQPLCKDYDYLFCDGAMRGLVA